MPHPMSQTISTDDSTSMFITEQTLMETTSHDGDTQPVTTTVSDRGTTNEEMATTTQTFSPTSQSTSFTSDSPGASHTHRPYEATGGPPSGTTSQLPSDNDITTTESNTQPPAMITSTKTQSHTDDVMIVTTPGSVTQETSSSPIVSTAHDGHEGSITTPAQVGTTSATPTTVSSETDRPTYFSGSIDSSVTTAPDRLAVLQGEEDKYNDVWKSSQHNLLQVSIISLMVLCMVCTAVCVMMVTLFFVVCKRRGGPRLVTRARYKKLSPTDKDLEETKRENEIEEYSFSEI